MSRGKIAFCENFSDLKKQGYWTQGFACVPFFIDRGIIEFDAVTSSGNLRCFLDSGATWNMMNVPEEGGTQRDFIQIASFKIADQDFGPVEFRPVPIKFPIHIQG